MRDDDETRASREALWHNLLIQAERGRLVPFLGAGASHESLPLASELARQIAVEVDYPDTDPDNLARVLLFAEHQRSPWDAKERVATLLKDYSKVDSRDVRDTHAGLVALDQEFFVTTNYDTYLEDALRESGRNPVSVSHPWGRPGRSVVDETTLEPSRMSPVVYHLHGHWDDPTSMVISESDYISFLANLERSLSDDRLLRTRLYHNMILFIGYGLRDWDVRVMFVLPSYSQRAYESVAVLGEPPSDARLRRWREDELATRDIRVYWGTAREFADELGRRRAALQSDAD